jgi:hypothetical protein
LYKQRPWITDGGLYTQRNCDSESRLYYVTAI